METVEQKMTRELREVKQEARKMVLRRVLFQEPLLGGQGRKISRFHKSMLSAVSVCRKS